MIFVVPAVEVDGKLTELKTDSLTHPYLRHLPIKEEGLPDNQMRVQKTVFEPKRIVYKIDEKRRVEAIVFVDVNFLRGSRSRDAALNRFFKKNSPWLFSYGFRRTET